MAKQSSSWGRKIGQFFIDLFEKYISAVAFSVMFLVFVLQIFFRYALNYPLTWPYEVTVFAFIWTTLLGACYALRMESHVVFSLLYDRLSPLGQLIFRLIGNFSILVASCFAVYPTYNYLVFQKINKSMVLQIPYNIAFGPYLVFLLLIAGRLAYSLVVDIRKIVRREV
ncbi:MAG TPA: TRAP transporter small permease [Spirochaetia bacterium]|nr:TRAP transporter small permease [Spirochaetia bacterium]